MILENKEPTAIELFRFPNDKFINDLSDTELKKKISGRDFPKYEEVLSSCDMFNEHKTRIADDIIYMLSDLVVVWRNRLKRLINALSSDMMTNGE